MAMIAKKQLGTGPIGRQYFARGDEHRRGTLARHVGNWELCRYQLSGLRKTSAVVEAVHRKPWNTEDLSLACLLVERPSARRELNFGAF